MRIAIGEFKQESNTFAPVPTTREHFRDFHLWYGREAIANLRDTNTEVAGFLDVCEAIGYTPVPTLAGFAISGAPLTAETYRTLRAELLERLAAARPFDAVLLALHGAMVAAGEDDPDGATLQAVRELIGPDIPLVASMDLHANLTRRCVEAADAIVGFRTSPHVDLRETGQRAARLLARWLSGEVRPTMAFVKVPMVVPASTHVHFLDGPFKRLMEATQAVEAEGALSASAFTVQPWLDIPEMGFATVAITDNDPERAEAFARRLARLAWAERHAFLNIDLAPPDQAIQQALASPAGPVILADLADGPAAGSPGDGTAMIAALLAADPPQTALVFVCDPEVAALAAEIGVGGSIDTLVGGKRDNVYNKPVRFTGTVTFAGPASYRFGGQGYTGIGMDMGLSAVLRRGNVHLLVTSKPVMTSDPALYRAVGLEPAAARIVVVKSHIQFRAGYADIARRILLLDTPGMSTDHLTRLDFRRVDRPLFPLDTDFEWTGPSNR
ncbi:MAG TPA: M81 family metallopeptidase [Chthonomonadaceae bacterium]|nr:M81 family metallopeptidase [Chthonomonadaceae bacterium]